MPAESEVPPRCDLRLIETLGWRAAAGFPRLDRHIARLTRSADALSFACDPDAVLAALEDAVVEFRGACARLRMTLDRDGRVEVTAAVHQDLGPEAEWRATIATQRLDPAEPLLAHKTTARDVYDAARAEAAAMGVEEAIFLNDRGELCEGGITNIFVEMGDVLLTPALDCGLLPGCLRAELLASGRACEAVLTTDDLRCAERWYLGNSLRGLIPARLVAHN